MILRYLLIAEIIGSTCPFLPYNLGAYTVLLYIRIGISIIGIHVYN